MNSYFTSVKAAVEPIVKKLLLAIGDNKLVASDDVINYAFSIPGTDVVDAVTEAAKPYLLDLLEGMTRNEDLKYAWPPVLLISCMMLTALKPGRIPSHGSDRLPGGIYEHYIPPSG